MLGTFMITNQSWVILVLMKIKKKDDRGNCDLELIIEKLKQENYDLKKQLDFASEEIQLKELMIAKLKGERNE